MPMIINKSDTSESTDGIMKKVDVNNTTFIVLDFSKTVNTINHQILCAIFRDRF